MYSVQCTVYIVHYRVYSVHNAEQFTVLLFTLKQYTSCIQVNIVFVYNGSVIRYTEYSRPLLFNDPLNTLYNTRRTLYTVQCIITV